MHQAANPAFLTLQFMGRPADHLLTGLADIGRADRLPRAETLQAKHPTGHVAGDALEARLALFQSLARTAAFGHIAEKYHQVLGLAIAQKAQGHVGRHATAIGTQAVDLETPRSIVLLAHTLPQ